MSVGGRGDPPSQLNSSICILIPTCRSLEGVGMHMHIKCGSLSPSYIPLTPPVLNCAQRTVFHKLPKHVHTACTITANLTNHLPSNRSSLHCLTHISYLLNFHAQVTLVTNRSCSSVLLTSIQFGKISKHFFVSL